MSSTVGRIEGTLPRWLIAVSWFVLALLSAYVPRPVGAVLVATALSGAVAAASTVARRRGSLFRALLPGLGAPNVARPRRRSRVI
jgi:ABC-type thiamin/hydroxymethylpyrimidine transport system permease subunit